MLSVPFNIVSCRASVRALSCFVSGSDKFAFPGIRYLLYFPCLERKPYAADIPQIDLSIKFRCVDRAVNKYFEYTHRCLVTFVFNNYHEEISLLLVLMFHRLPVWICTVYDCI